MENFALFLPAVLTVLVTPGPTNTLLAAAAALSGPKRAFRLIGAEIAGYLTSISLLIGLAAPLIARLPALGTGLRLAACLWLLVSAWKLWQGGRKAAPTGREIGFARVYFTTLFNPKGLLFAFGIFPMRPLPDLAPWFGLFVTTVAAAALGWIMIGTALAARAGDRATPGRIWRLAAIALTGFAVLIARQVLVG